MQKKKLRKPEYPETELMQEQALLSRKNKVMDGTAGLPEYRKRTLRFVQRFSYNGNKEASGFSASEEDLFRELSVKSRKRS